MNKTVVRVKSKLIYNFIEMQRVLTLKEMTSVIRTCKADIIIEELEQNEVAEATLIIESVLNKGGKVAYTGNVELNINGAIKFNNVNELKEKWFGSVKEDEEICKNENIDETKNTVVEEAKKEDEKQNTEEDEEILVETKEEIVEENIAMPDNIQVVSREEHAEMHRRDTGVASINTVDASVIENIRKEYEEKIRKLEEKHLIEIEKLKDEVDRANESARGTVERTESNFNNISENYSRLTERFNSLDDEFKKYKENSEKEYSEISEAKAKVEERLNREVETRNSTYEVWEQAVIKGEEFRKETLELKQNIEDLNRQHADELRNKDEEHRNEISNINNEHNGVVNGLNGRISELEGTISNYKSDIEALKDLDKTLSNYKTELDSAKLQISELTKKVEDDRIAMSDKNDTIARLTDSVKSLSDTGSDNFVRAFSYGGNAKVISVFGFGSYGITTIAHTLASECAKKGKTVIVGLDLERQSLKEWCKSNDGVRDTSMELERVDGARKIKLASSSKTGINYLILRKSSFFKDNLDRIVLSRNSLDYITGTNLKLTDTEIANIEFDRMMEILSEKYQYIVLDLGKMGYSNFQMSYIRAFVNISNLAVVIDKDIKDWVNLKGIDARLDKSKIDISKLVFINNFSSVNIKKDGTILEKVKQYIAIRYNRELLSNTNISNSELSKLVEL